MKSYNIIASTDESTVVAEYVPDLKRKKDYQSEAELEQDFIQKLMGLGYERIGIRSEGELIGNLRCQLELLNDFTFTDGEWDRFFGDNIANANEDIVAKTRKIQDDHVQVLKRDDGSTKNILLIHKKLLYVNKIVFEIYLSHDIR